MPPAQRTPVTLDLGEVVVESRPLPYDKAEDDLAEVYQIVMRVGNALVGSLGVEGLQKLVSSKLGTDDRMGLLMPLMPTFQVAADQLGNGTLKRLAPRIMFSTTATFPDENGKKQILELSSAANRATLFDGYPGTYLPILFHAGRVTFARFFPGGGLSAFLLPNSGGGGGV